MTQTLVVCGTAFGFAAEHAATAHVDSSLVALAWRGLWLTFVVSAFPTVLFTAAGVLGLGQADLSRPWVSGLGWVSAVAHVLVMSTVAQSGPFAPDGLIGAIAPATTVLWVIAMAVTLPGAVRRSRLPLAKEGALSAPPVERL